MFIYLIALFNTYTVHVPLFVFHYGNNSSFVPKSVEYTYPTLVTLSFLLSEGKEPTAGVWGEIEGGHEGSVNYTLMSGFLLEARSRVPAPVYFEQSTRLLKVCN